MFIYTGGFVSIQKHLMKITGIIREIAEYRYYTIKDLDSQNDETYSAYVYVKGNSNYDDNWYVKVGK